MPERTGPRFTLSFGGMLASVMVALKLKERWDDYKQISTDEEGRVALGSSVYRDHDPEGNNDEAISLINTDITVTRPKRKRAKCCMCCGLDCSLFWKAFGIEASSINRPESSPETASQTLTVESASTRLSQSASSKLEDKICYPLLLGVITQPPQLHPSGEIEVLQARQAWDIEPQAASALSMYLSLPGSRTLLAQSYLTADMLNTSIDALSASKTRMLELRAVLSM